MAENMPIEKPKELDQDLVLAMSLTQNLLESSHVEKDATNVFFRRFLKHCLSIEKFSKKMLMRFHKLLELINHEEIKPSLEQIEILLQIIWLFCSNLISQNNLSKDLWLLMFALINSILDFCSTIINILTKQVNGLQKKNEEQLREKKLENCLYYLHKTLKALYKQQSNSLEISEEIEKLKVQLTEVLKTNDLLQPLKIPPIDLHEIDNFLNNHEIIDMDKILEFSMVLKVGEDSELFSQMLSAQINDFSNRKENFLDSLEDLLKNSLLISSFSNQLYQDFLTWMLNLQKIKEESKLILALRLSIKILSEPKILSKKENILEWIINFIQQTTQIPAIFKVKFYLSLLKETIKHLAKIYTIDNDNMITLDICDLIFFNISQLSFDPNHLNRLEVTYYLEFLENIYQIFLIIKQEKNLSISDQPNINPILIKPDIKENKLPVPELVNNSMKSEEILNQSGEQMLEISEISSVVGMESELKDQTKDGLNFFKEKNMLLSEYNISKEEKPNKSKMNVLDEYSFDDFQGSLIKRDVNNISKTELGPGGAILEKSRNQIEKLNGILKNLKRVFEKFLKEDDFLAQIQKALDKKLFRKFLELIEECLMDQIFKRLAESLSEILSMILGKNLAFEKGFFNDFLLYLIGNLTESGLNKPFNFSLIFTILAQVLKETMVKRPGVYEENLGCLLDNLLNFYLCPEKEGAAVCKEYHLFLFLSLLRGVNEEKRYKVIERMVNYMEKQIKISKNTVFYENSNGYLALFIDGLALIFNQKQHSINFNGLLLDLITKRIDLEKTSKFGEILSSYFPNYTEFSSNKIPLNFSANFLKSLTLFKKSINENIAKFEAFNPQKHRFYLLLKRLDELTLQENFEFNFVFERIAWLESCNSLWRADLSIIKLQEVFKDFLTLYEPPTTNVDFQKTLKVESGLQLLLIKLNNILNPNKKAEYSALMTPEFSKACYSIAKTLNQEIQKETGNFLNILMNNYNEEELLNLKDMNNDFGLFFLAVHNFSRLADLEIFPVFSKIFSNEKLKLLLKIYCKFDQEIKHLSSLFSDKMISALKKHDILNFFVLQTHLYSHSLELLSSESFTLDSKKKTDLDLLTSSNRLIFLMLLMHETLILTQKVAASNKTGLFTKVQYLDLWFLELQYLQNKNYQNQGFLKQIFEEDVDEKKLQELHLLLIMGQKFKVFYCCSNAFSRLSTKLLDNRNAILLRIEKIYRKIILHLIEKELTVESNCLIFSVGLIKESNTYWTSILEPKFSNFLINSLINCPKPEAENALENFIIALLNYPIKKAKIKKEPFSLKTVSTRFSRKGFYPLLKLLKLICKPSENIKALNKFISKNNDIPAVEIKPKQIKSEKKKLVIDKKKEKASGVKKHIKNDANLEQPLRKKDKKRGFERKKPGIPLNPNDKTEDISKTSQDQGIFKPDALNRLNEALGLKLRGFFLEGTNRNLKDFLGRNLLSNNFIDNEIKGLLFLEKMEVEKEKNLEGIIENDEIELENSNASISFEQKSKLDSTEEVIEALNSLAFKEILAFFKALLNLEPETKDFPELILQNFGSFLMDNMLNNEFLKQNQLEKWIEFLSFNLIKAKTIDNNFLNSFIKKILEFLYQEPDLSKPALDHTPFFILLTQLLKFENSTDPSNMIIEESMRGVLSPIIEEKPSRKNSMTNLQEKMLGELFPMLPKDIENHYCTYTQNLKTKEKFISQHYYQCYTCDLKDGKGCCTICAYKCHLNHQVIYCRKAEFFCDCGSSGNCLCMKKDDNNIQKMSKPSAYNIEQPLEDPNGRLFKFHPYEKPKNAILDMSIGSEKNLGSLNMGFLPKEPSELVDKFEKIETGNNLELLMEEQQGEKYMWMEASEEEKPRAEESSSESEEREFQLIEENNPESSQTRFLKIKSLMQKLQGIDPNISISGLLGDRSKDLGLFGGLLRKTLKREALIEKENPALISSNVNNNNQPEKLEFFAEESMNLSYAPLYEEDNRSMDSNASMTLDSTNLLNFKKTTTLKNTGIQMTSKILINLSEPLKADNFLKILIEKQEKSQKDLITILTKTLSQGLEKLITSFTSQKPQKLTEITQQIPLNRPSIDWNLKFLSKLDHLLENKPAIISKTYSQTSFDYKARFDNTLINDKRMLSYLVLTNPPFRNPFELITNKNLIAIAENDRFSFYDKNVVFSGIFESWNNQYLNKPGLKSCQYYYQYEAIDNNSQTAFLNENSAPIKSIFKSPSLGYPIISLLYASNESSANQLIIAVIGLNVINIVTLDKSFNLLKKLPYENKIPQDYIIKALFLPNAENYMAILTLRSLKIINLQAENHPTTLVRFTLLDQTLFKDFAFMENPSNPKEKRLFVASNDGNLYTHLLNVDELQGLNEEELILVENIYFSPESKPNGKSIASVSYFPQSQLIFCGFEDGNSIAGKFSEKELEIINVIRLKPGDVSSIKGNFEPFLLKQGQILSQIKEISVDEEYAKYVGVLRKGNMIFGITIKMSKNSIVYQPLLPPNASNSIKSEGICLIPYPEKGVSMILEAFEDGSLHVFMHPFDENINLKALRGPNDPEKLIPVLKKKEKAIESKFNVNESLMKDGDTEAYVHENYSLESINSLIPCKIFIDFPERFQNITAKIDPNTVNLLEDFQTVFPVNARTFKAVSNILKDSPFILKPDKANINLALGFTTKDWVICGLRLKLGLNERNPELKIRIFEREYTLPFDKNKAPENSLILDIALTEPEIISVYLQGQIEFEFTGPNNSNKPLVVLFFGFEIYGCLQNEFNMKSKINALGQILRLSMKENENLNGNKLFNEKTFKNIQTALLNSKVLANHLDMHLKGDFLKNEIKNVNSVKLIHLIDILALFLIWMKSNKIPKNSILDSLLEPLKHLLLEEKLDKYLKSSMKRLIRSILNYQEKGLDYEGFKDLARMDYVEHEFKQPGLSYDKALSLYQLLAKIWSKRYGNMFIMFNKYPNFVRDAHDFLLNIIKSHGKDIEEAVFEAIASRTFKLLFIYYQFLRNQIHYKSKGNQKKTQDCQYIEIFFKQIFDLLETGDLDQRSRLMRMLIDGLKNEILNYNDEILNTPINIQLPKDLFENNSLNTSMEIEKTEENEEDLMNLAIEMSLKDPSSVIKAQEKERILYEIYTFEIFSDLFEMIIKRIEKLSKAQFEETAGCFFYLFYQMINLPMNYLVNKLISSGFSNKIDKYISQLYEMIISGLKNIQSQDLKLFLCLINLLNNFLKHLNKSMSLTSNEDKPFYKPVIRADTPLKRKHSSSIDQSFVTSPLKLECRAKFLNVLKSMELINGNFSALILKNLEDLQNQFIENKGSLRYEYNQGVFSENFKKVGSDPLVKYINDKAFAENWRTIFRRSELLKKGNGVFNVLDQGLYGSLIALMMNLMSVGYKEIDEKAWLEFICRSLIKPPTYTLSINVIKKLRNFLYKEQNTYNETFDQVIYQLKFEFLTKIHEASSSFKKPLTYDQMQFLLRTLNTLSRHSSKRPQIWSNFNENAITHKMLIILIETLPLNINEITENCLHLLAAYFTPLQLEEKASKLLNKGSKDYEELINKIIENGLSIKCKEWFPEIMVAYEFISTQIFLESNSKSLRMNSLKFLIALWFAGNIQQKTLLLNKMLQLSKNLIAYGNNVEHFLLFVNFLGCFLKTTHQNDPELKEILTKIYWELTSSFIQLKESLKNHKNFEMYKELYELLFDYNENNMKPRKMHYYFELNGCLKCYELMNSPYHELKLTEITESKSNNQLPSNLLAPNYADFKFDTFKYSEKKLKFNENVKFTGNSIIAKFNNTYEIDSITLIILENYKIKKTVKSVNISINNRIINDILDLKNLKSEWKFAKSQIIEEKTASGSRKTIKIPFTIPLTARNLKIEFFMSQLKGESVFGNCDICGSALLEDKYLGTFCLTCKERNREKQCPCCYNIIYEKNDSIFCVPDCGYCKFFDYEIVLSARIGSKLEKIDSSKAKDDCTKTISKILTQINDDSKTLFKRKQTLEELIKLFRSGEINQDFISNSTLQISDPNLKKSTLQPSQSLKSLQNSSLIQEISRLYSKEINGLYDQIMKNVSSVIISRKALFLYAKSEGDNFENSLELFDKGTSNPCFGCNMNYLSHLLRFFARSNNGIGDVNLDLVFTPKTGLMDALRKTLIDERLFNEMRNKARKAIVHLLGNNLNSEQFIESLLESSKNLDVTYISLVIEIIRNLKESIFMNQINGSLKKNQTNVEIVTQQEYMLNIFKKGVNKILQSLLKIIEDAQKDSNFAHKCLFPILIFIQKELSYSDLKEIIKKTLKTRESEFKEFMKNTNPNAMEEEIKETDKLKTASKDRSNKTPFPFPSFYEEVFAKFKHSIGVDVKKVLLYEGLLNKEGKPDINNPETIPLKIHKNIFVNTLLETNWISSCLQLTRYQNISTVICNILKDIYQSNNKLVLMILLKNLPILLNCELEAQHYFDLFKNLLKKYLLPENKSNEPGFVVYLLEKLINFVDYDLNNFKLPHIAQNELYLMNIDIGYGLNETLELIFALVKSESKPLQTLKKKSPELLKFIIRDLLIVKRLSIIKNQQFNNLESNLLSLFNESHSEETADKYILIKELCLALHTHQKDITAEIFLCEQIVALIEPVKKKYSVLLILEKKRSQEDYIKGSMKNNPYLADDIGTTIKNIRSKLYRDLELKFDENEPFFELLINDQIISVDLPISLVYEKVWIPHIMNTRNLEEGSEIPKDIPPMKIIYRIAGFEGEATENRIDRLNEDDDHNKDPEKRYEIAKTLLEGVSDQANSSSIALLLRRMKDFQWNNECIIIVGKLLMAISQVNAIREKIIELNGVGILLHTLLNRLGKQQTVENDQIIEILIGVLENVVISAESQGNNERMQLENEGEEEESLSYLNLCFKKLDDLNQQAPKPEKTITILTRILPFLAKDYVQSNTNLMEKYVSCVNFNNIDLLNELEKFIGIIEVLPKKFVVFRNLCLKYGVFDKIFNYIQEIIPNEQEINQMLLQDHQKTLTLALKLIKGMILNHKANQLFLFESKLLVKIYRLSHTSIKIKEIGKFAESIIEYLLQSDPNEIETNVLEYLKQMVDEEKLQKKKLAELKKQELLRSMKAGKKFIIEEKEKKMEIEEEEKSIKCIVCHEGYKLNPKNLLGAYLFTKSHRIPDEKSFLIDLLCKEVNGVGSVTHFNCIHLKCHNAAAKAELSMKKPKKEWEGAIIRNSHTKCNNWFPIKGEGIQPNEYEMGVMKYFISIEPLMRSESQCQSWIVLNDLKNLMMKFGKQESLSKESKGGSYEHNAKIIPFYLQMIIFLINKEDPNKLNDLNECLMKLLLGKIKEPTYEQVYLCLTISLLVINSNDFFKKYKFSFFDSFIKVILGKKEEKMQKATKNVHELLCFNNGESHEILKKAEDFLIKIRPLMTFLSLINEIYKKIYVRLQGEIVSKSLEEDIIKNYDLMIKLFEEVSNIYRNEIIKIASLEEFCVSLEIIGKDNSREELSKLLDQY